MIKFLDLKAINSRFQQDLDRVFNSFLESGTYILGNEVLQFEQDFSTYCGTKYCIGVSNGLDALKLIFEAYKVLGRIKEGDEVIVPANTYIASILAISNCNLSPVLVEPDLETYNIDPNEIKKYISTKTKAILGVHLYGRLYDIKKLEQIAREHDLLLIEDAAQSHGAKSQDGRVAGNVSHAAAFSFYPTKNLGALGDGGAITTNSKELYDVLIRLRNYGRTSTYTNDLKGFNCRLDELQATFLRIKLKYLDEDNEKRRTIAKYYIKYINSSKIILPKISGFNEHVFHQFIIRSSVRDKLQNYLLENGVETLIHYPISVHKQIAYKEFNQLSLPLSEKCQNEVLSLPINPVITNKDAFKITSLLNQF